jgi:hypothetical protein
MAKQLSDFPYTVGERCAMLYKSVEALPLVYAVDISRPRVPRNWDRPGETLRESNADVKRGGSLRQGNLHCGAEVNLISFSVNGHTGSNDDARFGCCFLY